MSAPLESRDVEALARALGVDLPDADNVTAQLNMLFTMAAQFEAVPLPNEAEPLPLFEP